MFKSQYAALSALQVATRFEINIDFHFKISEQASCPQFQHKKNIFDSQRLSYVRKNITACWKVQFGLCYERWFA